MQLCSHTIANMFASTRGALKGTLSQSAEAIPRLSQTARMSTSARSMQEAGPSGTSPEHNANVSKTPPGKKRQRDALVIDADSFPSLLREPHPVLDRYKTIHGPKDARYPSSVTFFNSPKLFPPTPPTAASMALSSQSDAGTEVDSASYLQTITPLKKGEINNLHQHLLTLKRVVKMTGKGKNARMQALVVAGNGKGLVGYGEGKDENAGKAASKAFHAAVKSMDYVERYNGHTIPAEVSGKWSATTVRLRPRPQGKQLYRVE